MRRSAQYKRSTAYRAPREASSKSGSERGFIAHSSHLKFIMYSKTILMS